MSEPIPSESVSIYQLAYSSKLYSPSIGSVVKEITEVIIIITIVITVPNKLAETVNKMPTSLFKLIRSFISQKNSVFR
jgi:hypothetical protein